VLESEPLVSESGDENDDKGRRLLGVRHDIFKPTAKAPKKAKAAGASGGDVVVGAPTAEPSGSGSGSGAGSTGSGSTGSSSDSGFTGTDGGTPATPAPAEKPRTWPANSLTVRFGDSSSESREKLTLRRLRALPSTLDPVVVFLRLDDDGKTAIFMLASGVQPTGDGKCLPDKRTCETIALKAGETEFLDIVDAEGKITAQYQLDVVAIHNPTVSERPMAARVATVGSLGLR